MKVKIIAGVVLSMGFASASHAAKIFEWNDPVTGNTPASCSAVQTYGTGGGGFLYNEYLVTCPGHSVTVTKYTSISYTPYYSESCTFGTTDSDYTTGANNCNNWRVYYN